MKHPTEPTGKRVATRPQSIKASSTAIPVPVEEFSRLVALVYRGTLEPLPWSGIIEALHSLLKASWVTLILRPASDQHQAMMINMGRDGGPHVAASPHIDPGVFALDPFMNLPGDRIVTADEVVGETNWLNSEYYKQFCAPAGVRYVMGADVHTDEGSECRIRLCRSAESPPFDEREKALCRMLLPHFESAVQLYTRLDVAESERQLLAGTVDRMLLGTVILDEATAQLGVRKNTARAQLRAIFSKTGVTRQTALVRLLLASVTPQ